MRSFHRDGAISYLTLVPSMPRETKPETEQTHVNETRL